MNLRSIATVLTVYHRRARWIFPAMAFYAAAVAPLHAGDAVPSPEALKAFSEFTFFLNQEFTRAAQDGTLLGPPETTLPEARKRCDALVAAAKDRKDIADAAQLTLQAYTYVVTNRALAKAQRKAPEDKNLADLMALNQAGPTEGQMMKCCQVMLVRLAKHFGKPSFTEEQVMARKDVDFRSLVIPSTSPAENAGEKALSIAVAVATDGSLKLNDKALPKQELVAALKKLKTEVAADGKEVQLTLYVDGLSKYERVIEVLDAATQAGVTNVTFQAVAPVGEEE